MTGFRVAPTRQVRLYEEVADQLREAILTGKFLAGDKLPIESELATQFGVSRAVVRQATLNLENEGLLTVLVGASGGTFVREPDVTPVIRAMENYFRHSGVTFVDYLHAKKVLEPTVLDDILRFSGTEHRERLEANIDEFAEAMRDGASDARLLGLSLDFHEILMSEVGNPVLQMILGALVRMGERVPEFRNTPNWDWQHMLDEHREILQSLEANNVREFRSKMLEHLDTVQHVYGNDSRADTDATVARHVRHVVR